MVIPELQSSNTIKNGSNAAIKAVFAINAEVPSAKPAEPDQFIEWQLPLADLFNSWRNNKKMILI
ncbi:hypothetical protein [Pedobacter antarcticus]|uniref:hypothetical protein n=1 Tax=Pedobacter antarcticus TaxID=34086 RepID=UPI00088493BD|nr:hypothetical protein [Pedobacter antarcticus]SDL69318.1 hypothetical protein SAMN04488084_102129 [Pedobacter antarcticus]